MEQLVCVSVKHLPPAHWQLSSGFQAEFQEEMIRGDINYPIKKTSICNVERRQTLGFICKHLKEMHSKD